MSASGSQTDSARWSVQFPVTAPPAIVVIVFALLAAYIGWLGPYAWIPHDDGTLAHSAERILDGELPHRDFDDAYTGGLSFWHALSFRVWGTHLLAMRITLWLVAVGFMFTFYRIARLVADAWISLIALTLAVTWSLPNYFAAMPSWYISFLALFAIASLLRFQAGGQQRWLFLAGVLGGIGILVKIQALFYIGASLMALAFFEVHSEYDNSREDSRDRSSIAYRLFLACLGVVYVGLILVLVRRHLGPMEALTYVVPTGLLCMALFSEDAHYGQAFFGRRFGRLSLWTTIYLAGLLAPLVLLVGVFAIVGAAGDFVSGVLAVPTKWIAGDGGDASSAMQRFTESADAYKLPSVGWFVAAVPLALYAFAEFSRWKPGRAFHIGVAILLGAVFLLASFLIPATPNAIRAAEQQPLRQVIYPLLCYSFRCAGPAMVIVLACQLLDRKRRGKIPSDRRAKLFLLGMVATQVSLMQYPYATAVYFFYVAPLFVLAVLMLVSTMRVALRPSFVAVAVFYILFAGAWLNTGFIRSHGVRYLPARSKEPLQLDRGHIKVTLDDTRLYQELVEQIQSRVEEGQPIYAAPDCPEVYFLSDRSNPGRGLFDVLLDPQTRTAEYLDQLDAWGVGLVVVNQRPEFSERFPPSFIEALQLRFPVRQEIGDKFVIFAKN